MGEVALRILDKLLADACEETILHALAQEKRLRSIYGKAEPVQPTRQQELTQRAVMVDRKGVDIYGQTKSTEARYFTCRICERLVAGNRFAAHVAKCIARGRRQRTTYA